LTIKSMYEAMQLKYKDENETLVQEENKNEDGQERLNNGKVYRYILTAIIVLILIAVCINAIKKMKRKDKRKNR